MKVLVLAGGDSGEREVSFATGKAVIQSLRRMGHDVLAIDPSSGRSLLDSKGQLQIANDSRSDQEKTPAEVSPRALANSMAAAEFSDVEVVFVALHGETGENGTIQNLLHLAGKKYTGSGMAASALAMDKGISKRLMVSVGVRTPKWKLVHVTDDAKAAKSSAEIEADFELPVIVKPNDGGSTIGLTKVTTAEGIVPALKTAAACGEKVLVEKYIEGRELTVSVLDGRAFPLVEIKPVNGLYDYEAKYTKGKSEYIAPAEVEEAIAKDMQAAAVKVFEVIGASGLARIDFILAANGDFYCLELNSLPGMTDLSLVPMALKCEGIDFDQLVTLILESALKRND
jgi:D-alanine-D-alanine ligase